MLERRKEGCSSDDGIRGNGKGEKKHARPVKEEEEDFTKKRSFKPRKFEYFKSLTLKIARYSFIALSACDNDELIDMNLMI